METALSIYVHRNAEITMIYIKLFLITVYCIMLHSSTCYTVFAFSNFINCNIKHYV